MTMRVAPQTEVLRKEIQLKYAEVAENPDQTFHFLHGRPMAERLKYPMDLVDTMPAQAVESFAGQGNPFSVGSIQSGETVLDVGSGAGFDCFIAGQSVGPGPFLFCSGETSTLKTLFTEMVFAPQAKEKEGSFSVRFISKQIAYL